MRPKTPFVLASLIAFTLAPAILAVDSESTRESLRGIPGVYVLIEHLNPDAESDGLTRTQLRTDVELKLRLAGIKVFTREERFLGPEELEAEMKSCGFERVEVVPLTAGISFLHLAYK